MMREKAVEAIYTSLAEEMYPSAAEVPPEEAAAMRGAAKAYLEAAEAAVGGQVPFFTSFPAALAREFHETYERLAPDFGYKTREASAVPWEDVPDENRGLMIAVCGEILERRATAQQPQRQDDARAQLEDVRYLAIKAGAYDAADAISGLLGRPTLGGKDAEPLVDFARWIVRLDDPEGEGMEERRRVTMTGIINRAHRALAQGGLGPRA